MITTVAHHPAVFQEGDQVHIALRNPIGHYRVPTYIRGHQGKIIQNLGRYINPEEEAFGKNAGNKLWYYRVQFTQTTLWPGYQGKEGDVLEIEIFENWLEKI